MKNSPTPTDLIPLPRDPGKAPVLFMLQPKGFRRNKTPEDLALWEQWMIERVGFRPDAPILNAYRASAAAALAKYANGGVSGSNGGWDD